MVKRRSPTVSVERALKLSSGAGTARTPAEQYYALLYRRVPLAFLDADKDA
jgi:hypothetical protein